MGILGKTSGLFRLSATPKSSSQGNSATARAVTPEEFQPLIQGLLAAEALDSPEAKNILRRIKTLADGCSPFFAASEIQRCVRRFSFTDADGKELDRSRAFELAAKLHWDNLHHQVTDADAGGRPLGPTVYATFLDELIECLIQSKDPMTCVQIPLLLNEEFLLKSLTRTDYTPTLISLVTRTMDSILDYAVVKDAHPEASGNGSDSEEVPHRALPSGPILYIDAQIEAYLKTQKRLLADIGREMVTILGGRNPVEDERDEETLHERKDAYYEVLSGILDRYPYHAFSGAVSASLSTLHAERDLDSAIRHAEQAIENYTAQAEQDRELGFELMAERHQHEADGCSKTTQKLESERASNDSQDQSNVNDEKYSTHEDDAFPT